MKGLLRYALIWAISMMLAPYVTRFFERMEARAPRGTMIESFFQALGQKYSASLVRSLGESAGEFVFGPK
jgi:hypothetical protein